MGIGEHNLIFNMCANYNFDANFAAHLINSLKKRGVIKNGVTLPFMAYAYKRLNCDTSTITEDYLLNIVTSLENAGNMMFLFQHCSEIQEYVIALHTVFEDRIMEQGFYTRYTESTMLYDPKIYQDAPSAKQLYDRYYNAISNNTFSRVWKEYKYDWEVVSNDEDEMINGIIENYKKQ